MKGWCCLMDNNKRQIILYGLGGADIQYCAVSYYCVYEEDISILTIRHHAELMREYNPTVRSVYAIDNRPGLKRDYMYSIKKHSIESCIEFKDLLERYGIRVL